VLWHAGSEDEEREYYSVLKQAFRDIDYVEGKNAEFLHRYPAERIERFEQLAKDLVDCNTELIVVVKIRGAAASRLIHHSRS
jgi:putative tryptophan/tyrosine transport system substrate-binding protein